MNERSVALDRLIEQLRARAMDPERRADVIVDAFSASARTMDLANLLGASRGMAVSLDRLVGEIRSMGRPGPASRAAADAVRQQMTTPAKPTLPAVASPAAVAEVEAELGARLAPAMRRAYLEIADGGFGPGEGLLGIDAALAVYRDMRSESPGPRRSTWPAGLLPVVARNPGYDCVEVSTGRVIGWDPEGLAERSGDAAWQRSFVQLAPSADAWLTEWVGSRTQKERTAELMARARVGEARRTRAEIAKKSPEERAAMGLPEVGWERVVWGGIGLEEDEA